MIQKEKRNNNNKKQCSVISGFHSGLVRFQVSFVSVLLSQGRISATVFEIQRQSDNPLLKVSYFQQTQGNYCWSCVQHSLYPQQGSVPHIATCQLANVILSAMIYGLRIATILFIRSILKPVMIGLHYKDSNSSPKLLHYIKMLENKG